VHICTMSPMLSKHGWGGLVLMYQSCMPGTDSIDQHQMCCKALMVLQGTHPPLSQMLPARIISQPDGVNKLLKIIPVLAANTGREEHTASTPSREKHRCLA
jgi:hypothetical protein